MTEDLATHTNYWKISADAELPDWVEEALNNKRLGINDEVLDPFEAPFVMKKKVHASILDDFMQAYSTYPLTFGRKFINVGFYPLEKIGDYLYIENNRLHYCTDETFQKKFPDLNL
jgi:hypothetical protein